MSKARWIVAAARVLMGGLFIYAAYMKLADLQQFAFSVKAFKMLPEHLVVLVTFALPWTELLCGVALVLGLWTRSAALVIQALLGGFLYAMFQAIERDLDIDCSCFGDPDSLGGKLFGSKVGSFSIGRNIVFMGITALPLLFGAGTLGADLLFRRSKKVETAGDES